MTPKKFKLRQFGEWIEANGGRVLPLSKNEWEVLRYVLEGAVLVVYKDKSGHLTIPDRAWSHYQTFIAGAKIGTVSRVQGKRRERIYATLAARDGTGCCFCNLELGDDITIEHWLAIDAGGSNDPRNLALAHESCNKAADSLPVVQKIALRDKLRGGQGTASNLPSFSLASDLVAGALGITA